MKLGITMGKRGNMELGVVMVVIGVLFFIIGSRGGGALDFGIGILLVGFGAERFAKARKAKREETVH